MVLYAYEAGLDIFDILYKFGFVRELKRHWKGHRAKPKFGVGKITGDFPY